MKRKHLSLAVVALIVAGGLWLARTGSRTVAPEKFSVETLEGQLKSDESKPGQMGNQRTRLAPPNPSRRFKEFTPEQRVEFARKGHGPGG